MADWEKIEKMNTALIKTLHDELDWFNEEELQNTPKRITRYYKELLDNHHFNFTTFDVPIEQTKGMIVLKNIDFYSNCSHHLLPFYGKIHIAYLPSEGGKVCGVSKLARTAKKFASKPQLQEQLTNEITEYLNQNLHPWFVMVIVEARHLCYDKDTMLLTNIGWKLFSELNKDTLVAQYDKLTKRIDFVKPLAYLKEKYNGKMVDISSVNAQLVVTPDHRVLGWTEWGHNTYKKARNQLKDYSARDIFLKSTTMKRFRFYVPTIGTQEGIKPSYFYLKLEQNSIQPNINKENLEKVNGELYLRIPMDVWLNFLGWYISEGSITKSSNNRYSITISQQTYLTDLCIDMQKFPITYNVHKVVKEIATIKKLVKGGIVLNNKSLYNWLDKNVGKYSKNKKLPEFLFKLDKSYVEHFLHTYYKGDGWKEGTLESRTAGTVSKKLAYDLLALLTMNGISASVYKSINPIHYIVRERKKTGNVFKSSIYLSKAELIDYNDYVYSVQVPTSYIIVLRKGIPIISGNCMLSRGIKQHESEMVTSAIRWDKDKFKMDVGHLKDEAMSLIYNKR